MAAASAKKCIAAMCKDCIYDPEEAGSWRSQVEACTFTSCPLYPVRPLTVETIQANRKKRPNKNGLVETVEIE